MANWIVYSSTNIGNKKRDRYGDETHAFAFESFEEARDKAREILKSYAYGEPNEIFDGSGTLVNYCREAEDYNDEDYSDYEDEEFSGGEEDGDSRKNKNPMMTVCDCFRAVFAGEQVNLTEQFDEDSSYNTNWMLAYKVIDGRAISIFGEDDGPCNGIDPHIYSDMFDMTEPRNYITYIDDWFESWDSDGFLVVRIMKSES